MASHEAVSALAQWCEKKKKKLARQLRDAVARAVSGERAARWGKAAARDRTRVGRRADEWAVAGCAVSVVFSAELTTVKFQRRATPHASRDEIGGDGCVAPPRRRLRHRASSPLRRSR